MFTNEHLWLIIRYLGLSQATEDITRFKTILDTLEADTNLSSKTEQILSDLNNIGLIEARMVKTLGITKADVVSFDARLRALGLISQMIQLAKQISRSLGLELETDLSLFEELRKDLDGNNTPWTICKVRG